MTISTIRVLSKEDLQVKHGHYFVIHVPISDSTESNDMQMLFVKREFEIPW